MMMRANFAAAVLLILVGKPVHAQAAADPYEIVRKSVERDWTDFSARKDYTYLEKNELRQLKKDGGVAHVESKTNEITLLVGRRYERLIARDGKPLSAKETAQEQAKLDRELIKRQHEAASVQNGERTKEQREREENRRFIREIPDAFTFHLLGTETVSGQAAWVLDAQPKPGFHPKQSDAKMFQKLRAKIWIEQTTFRWVKVDVDVLDTLSFAVGMFRVAPGATVHFEQIHVNGELWLPSMVLVRADARLALLKKLRAEVEIRYSDYKKFQSESRMESVTEQ